jgi:hypothetical protein
MCKHRGLGWLTVNITKGKKNPENSISKKKQQANI